MKTGNPSPDYRLQHRYSPEHVEVQFEGLFMQKPVTWHAHIRTLGDYCLHELYKSQQPSAGNCIQAQPFIDIDIHDNIHRLTVALNIPVIDEAAILRTIIMIRQYKRLQAGRHQYGDIATFSFASP